MTPADMADVLGACAAYDGRTIGISDVAAWHKSIGHLDKADAIEAVARYYGAERDRIMPADVARYAREVRNERASRNPHEIRDQPSRFELDEIRDTRVRNGVAQIAAVLTRAMPDTAPGDAHSRALVRARRERTTPMPLIVKRKGDGKPFDLSKVPGPAWTDPETRERESVAALHDLDRPCGRAACPRPACRRTPRES